jgi:hypothetical protein
VKKSKIFFFFFLFVSIALMDPSKGHEKTEVLREAEEKMLLSPSKGHEKMLLPDPLFACDLASCVVYGWCCGVLQAAKLHSYVLGERPPRCCSKWPCLFIMPFMALRIGIVGLCLQNFYLRKRLIPEENDDCKRLGISLFCLPCSIEQMTAHLEKTNPSVPVRLFMDDSSVPLLTEDERDEKEN